MSLQINRVLIEHLSTNSSPYQDPISSLPWHSLTLDDYWLPPEAISLYGLPEFEALDELHRKRVSQYEFISFIQSGIWLEGIFIERLVKATRKPIELSEHMYSLHELREEIGHSLMFLELMKRSGLAIPKIRHQWPWLVDRSGRYIPRNTQLFWMSVIIGEEVPDKLNRQIRLLDSDQLSPVIREMSTLHIKDEARHIAFARSELNACFKRARFKNGKLTQVFINYLFNQFVSRFYYPHISFYEYAGLEDGKVWLERAKNNPHRHQFILNCVTPTIRLFQEYGINLKLPFQK